MKPSVVNVDGEILRHDGTIDIECRPKAFSIFVPPDWQAPTVAQAEAGRNKDTKPRDRPPNTTGGEVALQSTEGSLADPAV